MECSNVTYAHTVVQQVYTTFYIVKVEALCKLSNDSPSVIPLAPICPSWWSHSTYHEVLMSLHAIQPISVLMLQSLPVIVYFVWLRWSTRDWMIYRENDCCSQSVKPQNMALSLMRTTWCVTVWQRTAHVEEYAGRQGCFPSLIIVQRILEDATIWTNWLKIVCSSATVLKHF